MHDLLALVADDVVRSLRGLSRTIAAESAKSHEVTSEADRDYFTWSIHADKQTTLFRKDLYHLVVAICCEELLNRFSYFELPAETSEVIEKLQPTEKLLMIAAFFGNSGVKSSHVYEGLKSIVNWRNRFAHGHNPGRSAKSLHINHATLPKPEHFLTLGDELKILQKTSMGYQTLTSWLLEVGTHPMTKPDWYYCEACRITCMFNCFSTSEHCFPPDDADGQRHTFFGLDVDETRLADVSKGSL